VEINNLLAKKYDFDESDLRQFACEFFDFAKFIQTNEFNNALNEIVDPAFYKVEYKKSDVDFSKYL